MRVKDGRECLKVGRGQGVGESLGVVYNYYWLDMLCTDLHKNTFLYFYVFQNPLIYIISVENRTKNLMSSPVVFRFQYKAINT